MLVSCGRTDKPARPPAAPETPKALKEDAGLSEVTLVSKSSGREDMIESIYRELVAKDAGLTDLETQLDGLGLKLSDSTRAWSDFDGKNHSYYHSAGGHIEAIKDSILRKKMEMLIAGSDTAYGVLTGMHKAFLAQIDKKQLSVADLHEVLKLTRTLPVIEQYQKRQLPATRPLKHTVEAYEGVEQQEEKLIKK